MAEDELPDTVVERAETLTRRARKAVDENEQTAYLEERGSLLSDHGYRARVREDDATEILVLYPDEWVEDGTVEPGEIDDTGRAVERRISGPASGDNWAEVDRHNRTVAERVREEHGQIHGETADAFATFMSNHYAKPVEEAAPDEKQEFRDEYFPRNAWPSDEQLAQVEASLEYIEQVAERVG